MNTFLQPVKAAAGFVIVAVFVLALTALFNGNPSATRSQLSPLPTATAPISPLPTPIVTSGPTPTPYPTPRPRDFTPSPSPTPSPTPEGAPVIITDPEGNFSLRLLPGWRAYVGGTTVIINYDDENLGGEGNFPPGALKIQIGVGKLEPGQSFEQWLSDWMAISTSFPPDFPQPTLTATDSQPYTLGRYEGVTYFINSEPRVLEIVLPVSDGRAIVISLTPADSPALSEALSMLSALDILPEPLP